MVTFLIWCGVAVAVAAAGWLGLVIFFSIMDDRHPIPRDSERKAFYDWIYSQRQ